MKIKITTSSIRIVVIIVTAGIIIIIIVHSEENQGSTIQYRLKIHMNREHKMNSGAIVQIVKGQQSNFMIEQISGRPDWNPIINKYA